MKICPVGTELLHADRRTDVTKQIVTFRNFANAPKKAKTRQHGYLNIAFGNSVGGCLLTFIFLTTILMAPLWRHHSLWWCKHGRVPLRAIVV